MEQSAESQTDKLMDLVGLCRYWGMLIDMGVPIIHATDAVKEKYPRFSNELEAVSDSWRGGQEGAAALLSYTDSLHPLLPMLLHRGEMTGSIGEVLADASEVFESEYFFVHNLETKPGRCEERNVYLGKIWFYSALGDLLNAGIPLDNSLNLISNRALYPDRAVLDDIKEAVRGYQPRVIGQEKKEEMMNRLQGIDLDEMREQLISLDLDGLKQNLTKLCPDDIPNPLLSMAMEKHPATFTKIEVAAIKSGEIGGGLYGVCHELATSIKHEYWLKFLK